VRVLVTGGAGYLGSHTSLALIEAGHFVVVADNFSNSKNSVIERMRKISGTEIELVSVDLQDVESTGHLFARSNFDAVMHFAGFKVLSESTRSPLKYYRNNLDTTFSLLSSALQFGVNQFVFSSSAAVYGRRLIAPYMEDPGAPLEPTNPYGWTKLMCERVLSDAAIASTSMKAVLLRYFNPVGAHPSGLIGDDPPGVPTTLMSLIVETAVGRRSRIEVYGGDYATPDGTCLRDYVHVQDVASGHVAALRHISEMTESARVFNLGTGRATSVLELIKAFERTSGVPIPHELVGRRPGDISAAWADPTRARRELGWVATRSVELMCADSLRWRSLSLAGRTVTGSTSRSIATIDPREGR
jgi:UDP-glucose 4-epimerase